MRAALRTFVAISDPQDFNRRTVNLVYICEVVLMWRGTQENKPGASDLRGTGGGEWSRYTGFHLHPCGGSMRLSGIPPMGTMTQSDATRAKANTGPTREVGSAVRYVYPSSKRRRLDAKESTIDSITPITRDYRLQDPSTKERLKAEAAAELVSVVARKISTTIIHRACRRNGVILAEEPCLRMQL